MPRAALRPGRNEPVVLPPPAVLRYQKAEAPAGGLIDSGEPAGVADTFMAKNRAKTWDAKLAKLTKWVAIGFVVITFVMCLL